MKWVLSVVTILLSGVLVWFGVVCYYANFYPVSHKEVIIATATRFEIEPSLIAAVINVESGFNQSALSSKGAVGLMQVLPSTAEWVCDKLGREFDEEKLFDINENILIGGYYLSYLVEYFDNQNLAICAYNAGMGNVKKWLANENYSSNGASLDKIPFEETEKYLSKVLKNISIYKNKF